MANKGVKKLNPSAMRVTVYFGYALFITAIVLLAMNLFPWFNPNDPNSFNEYSLLFAATLILSALLPPIAGYFIGDRSSKVRSPLVHHYNGVLFAVLGFWLSAVLATTASVLGWFDFVNSMELHALTTLLPPLVTVAILVALGVFYAKHTRHQKGLDDYVPYRAVFISSFVSLFLMSGITVVRDAFTGYDAWSSLAALVLPSILLVAFTAFGAWLLGRANGTVGERIMHSLVATSYVLVAITLIGQISFIIDSDNQYAATLAFALGLGAWVAYIVLLRRASKGSK